MTRRTAKARERTFQRPCGNGSARRDVGTSGRRDVGTSGRWDGTVASTIDTYDSTIVTIDSTFDTIDSTIDTIDSTINTIDSTIDTIDRTIDTRSLIAPLVTCLTLTFHFMQFLSGSTSRRLTSAGRSSRAERPMPPAAMASYAAHPTSPSSNLAHKNRCCGPRRPRHLRRGAVYEAVSAE